jgi:hypothetical protein
MPGVSISDLTSDYLFEARIRYTSDNQGQLSWLIEQYTAEAADRSGAEITATSFKGSSHSAQFRASTPDERRSAIRSAIETVEATIAGATATEFRKPFGFRFLGSPHDSLG